LRLITLIIKDMDFRDAYQKTIAQIKVRTFASGMEENKILIKNNVHVS
jgi:hypothetical protein